MFRKSILASTLSLLLLPSGAWALGLGGIRPESALNQPFVGEIELLGANPDQLDSVKVVLAQDAEFAKRGTERQHYLTKLRFKPQISARGKMVVRVTSTEPIREPYMDFLVEVIWPKGRLVKGYTVLLDPPVTARRSPPLPEPPVARTTAAAPAATRAQAPTTAPAVTPPAGSAVRPVTSAAAAAGFPLRYGPIKPGTGLWRAARQMAPAGATIHQTAMALYRNNQQAFVRGNINKLRQGEVLQIPTSAEIFAMDAGTAEREFRAALSGKRVTAKPLTDVFAAASEAESRLTIAGTAKSVEPQPAPTEGQATAPSGGPAAPDIEQELLLVRETGESTRQETDELRERVHQLESSLADIQQLLTLRDAELARLQSGQASATVPADAATGGIVPAEAQGARDADVSPTAAAEGLDQVAAIVPAGEIAAAVEPRPAVSVEPLPASGAEPAEPQAAQGVSAAGVDATLPEGRVAADVTVTPTGPVPTGPAETGPEESGPSWLGSVPLVGGALRAVPEPVLWSGLVAVPLLGLLGWLSMRRRRSEELAEFALATPMAPDYDVPTARGSGTDTARAFRGLELEEPSPPRATEAGDLGLASIEEEAEASDVISEADIYIAYGRYRDAEDLLKQAIGRFPRRADLRYRLADVYAGARNDEGLAALISEMKEAGMDEEDPEQWSRLVGQTIVPTERPTAAVAVGAAAPAAAPGLGGAVSLGPLQRDAGATHRPEGVRRTMAEQGYVAPPVGDVDSFSPDVADSLVMDFSRHQDASFGLETLDLGTVVTTAEPQAAGTQPDSGPGSARKGDAKPDLELDMSDLTPATEFDLAELGVFAPMPAVPDSPTADSAKRPPIVDSDQWLDVEPIIGLDTMPSVDADEGTPPGTEDLAQAWAEPVRFSGGPVRGGGGLGTDRLKLESNEQDAASSELFSSEWHMDGGVWDEAATKLDLGRAYVEMGDRQAAEALLLEVAEEGNPEQQAEARELLVRIEPN